MCVIFDVGSPDAILGVVVAVDVAAEPFPCQPAHRRGPHQAIIQGEGGPGEHGHEQGHGWMHCCRAETP